ncbi:membrane associated rhomboid family serine protease [Kibdelosporangium banguiense]|uniref:Membrane associated rhomboid family serine protease n=1 Tax=Kibdelosporangium banguiense TaxID=1365924 RepID=A0ABS4TBN1_9PSEU|nr:rhomboid family intramembrane serine protease [Kibdelosporangium banguiense]MBP2321823.1 membrane associated rhomboid family serine protease [Kibdelosporangium banguiense]
MTSPEQPACVRHPDRPTGLRCVRCERPACPECLREASVGYQCVDCVNEGRRTQRQATTVAGAQVTTNTKPVVVPILVLLNVGYFVLNAVQASSLTSNSASISFEMGVLWPPVVASGEWWRLITSGFLHYGPIHLLMNMFALWIIGRDLELLLGRVRFAALYLVALLGGSTAVFLFSSMSSATAGASGAVFGLMGAMAVAVFRLKLPVGQALGIIALNIVFSFTVPQISWLGHIGGLVTGALVAIGLLYPPAKIRTQVQVATVVGLLVVLVALVFVRDGDFAGNITCEYNPRLNCYRLGA